MNKIIVSKQLYDRQITKPFIKEKTELILDMLKIDNVEVGITLTDNETIKELNTRWRNKNRPTDVLSFPINEKPYKYRYTVLGDVVISLPFAKAQAKQIGITYKEEVLRLLTHGILHLLGYDHEKSQKEAKIMFDLQEKILSNIYKDL